MLKVLIIFLIEENHVSNEEYDKGMFKGGKNVRLIVLGCFGPYPTAGQSCSGYLLQNNDTSILLDCGNGVLSRLRYHMEPWNLNAVILSHLHSDHVSDLMIMRYAIMLRRKQEPGRPLPVYAPGFPENEFARLSYKEYVAAEAITESTQLELGGMLVTFKRGVHPYPSYFISVESEKSKFVYSGDTEDFPSMAEIVQGADLFLCEANYLRSDIENGSTNHLAAYQAATVAKQAGVGRLVLTHHHPERNPALGLGEAQSIFKQTELAKAGSIFFL